MKQTYLRRMRRSALRLDICREELCFPRSIDNGYSLYIGIPFCPTTCLYCSFTSYPSASWAKRVDSYLDALEREIELQQWDLRANILNSIYIGGGTPTTLEHINGQTDSGKLNVF